MKTSLAGIAWFILNLSQRGAAQLLEPHCRTSNSSGNGGVKASTWTVALKNETNLLCAGSLIHTRFVLTAAQCLDGQRTLIAMLGANDIAIPATQVSIGQVLIHRLYSRETGENNIGLAMLSHYVNYSDHIRPICIILNAVRSQVESWMEFETFGWGIGTNRQRSETLQRIKIKRQDRSLCGNALEQSYICAGPSRADDCGGDIGGPLFKSVSSTSHTHQVQFGIVGPGQRHCEGLRTYIDVTSYADWIERIVKAFETLDVDVRDSELSQEPRPPHHGNSEIGNQNQRPESSEAEEMWLYNDCGKVYLTANIFGTGFTAKGVMITHRFVLTAASGLLKDITSLRVEVEGLKMRYEGITIESVYMHGDMALLKLSRELPRQDSKKPICVLKKATPEESNPLLTVLGIDRTQTKIRAIFMRVQLGKRLPCSADLMNPINQNQICVQSYPTIRQDFGIPGNAVSQKIVLPGKNNSTYALFGIASYSSNGIHIITKVGLYTDWIASVVSENTAE